MGSQADSSAEFGSSSFDRALAELPLSELEGPLPGPADIVVKSVRFSNDDEATPSPDWPDEDELAAFDEFEAEQSRKRKREAMVVEDVDEPQIKGSSLTNKDISQVDPMYEDHPAYVASKFGGIGAYLRHKREKLQNAAIAQTQGQNKPQIFQGLEIYINGYTVPPLDKLRTMIMQHGGTYIPYLDRKGMITHILATNLTPVKFKEFANYKVATPTWIVDSVDAGKLLDWRKYKLMQNGGSAERQGLSQFLAPREIAPVKKDKGKGREIVDVSVEGDRFSVPPEPFPPQEPSIISHQELLDDRRHNLQPTGIPLVQPTVETLPPLAAATVAKSAREIFAPTKGQAPPLSTDPITFEGAAWMGYAKNAENKEAKRLMQNQEWREQNTAVSDKFLEGYYKNSRLHHLSTWKSELKTLVAEAQKRAEETSAVKRLAPRASQRQAYSLAHAILPRIPERVDAPKTTVNTSSSNKRVIMHVDFDAFFVSCGLASRPELRGKPVVVCHAQGNQGASSTSEIASCSYEARAHGVKNGMSLGQARGLCADIRTIPYEFDLYREKSLSFYTILMSYADEVQAVSIDEALVDVTQRVLELEQAPPDFNESSNEARDYAKLLAEDVRADMREATDCEVSIGIASNILLSRLATRHAKPAGSYHLKADEVDGFMAPLDVGELHNFGYATKKKIESTFGTTTCGELTKITRGALQACLGEKNGQTLFNFVRGIDPRPLTPHQERRSVSAEVNYGIRFVSDEEVVKFLTDLSQEVARRLRGIDRLGRQATLKVMVRNPDAPQEAPKFMGHGVCDVHNKSLPISGPTGGATDDGGRIASAILKIYESQRFDAKELRGIGIQVQKLESRYSAEEQRAPGQGVLAFATKSVAPIKIAKEPVDLTMDSSPVLPGPVTRSRAISKPKPEPPPPKPTVRRTKAVFKPVQILPSDIDLGVWAIMDTAMRDEYRGGWRMSGVKIPSAFERSRLAPGPTSPANARHGKGIASRETSVVPLVKSKAEINRLLASLGLVQEDLATIGMDVDMFAALDPDVQSDLARDVSRKKTLFRRGSETPTRSPQRVVPHKDIVVSPTKRPTIRMGSSEPQQDLGSVLDGLSTWMDVAAEREPNPREVKVLRKYLRRCLDPASSSIGGVQDASQVLLWWEKLCKRRWPARNDDIAGKWFDTLADARREVDGILEDRYSDKVRRRRL